MTERRGNTDAPDVESREESAPRRASSRDAQDLGTSWSSVIFGWLAALGAGLILSGIIGAVVGGIFAALGAGGLQEGGISSLVGLLLTLFLAFLIGGYVAGRLASRSGLKHGLLVPLLSLVITLLLGLLAGALGAGFIDQLGGVTLPALPPEVQGQMPQQNLGTIFTVSGILALLAPFLGGALGGPWGEKTGSRRP
jgi:MFS family permease